MMAALLVPFPLSSWLGLAAVALVTLRRGSVEGLIAGLAVLATLLLTISHPLITASNIAELSILLLCCAVLRSSVRLDWALLVLVLLVAAFVLLVRYSMMTWLLSYEKVLLDAMKTFHLKMDRPVDLVEGWALQSLAIGMSVKIVIALLLGRWWQSVLYFPGAFTEAFMQLKLSPNVASVLLLSAMGVHWGEGRYAALSVVFLLPLVVISVALVHYWIRSKRGHPFWLMGFYLLLPMGYLFAALLAWVDSFVKWREREKISTDL